MGRHESLAACSDLCAGRGVLRMDCRAWVKSSWCVRADVPGPSQIVVVIENPQVDYDNDNDNDNERYRDF